MMYSPPTPAMTRCAMCSHCSPKFGSQSLVHSGHDGQIVLAPLPTMYVPDSRITIDVAAIKRTVLKYGCRSSPTPPAVAAGRAISSATMSIAKSVSAANRCAVTMGAGSSVSTVMPPSTTCTASAATATAISRFSPVDSRCFTHTRTAHATTRAPTTLATSRCEYSMRTWYSNGGMICPWQSGQSGQPRPDSVARTTPPSVISPNVAATVTASRIRRLRCEESLTTHDLCAGAGGSLWIGRRARFVC